MESKHLIVITCNWQAYQNIEMAGALKLDYDARVLPVRLTCLSRVSTGIILKAFEQGALGVLLLGCPSGTCHYESGFTHAEEVVKQARKFLDLLGYAQERLWLRSLAAESDESFTKVIRTFLNELDNLEPVPKIATAIPTSS